MTGLFFVVVVSVLGFRLVGEGGSVSTSVSILNALPVVNEMHVNTVSSTSFSDAFLLLPSPGGIKTVYLNGIATDPNGDADITSIQAFFYESDVELCSVSSMYDDKNKCYRNTSCSVQNVNGDDSVTFTCPISMQYYANATLSLNKNWIARVVVRDTVGADDATVSTEVGEIISVYPSANIDFGSLYAGESTNGETNAHMTVVQTGNSPADINISGSPMTCTSGNIPRANIQYTLTDIAGGTPLTSAFSMLTAFNLPVRTDDSVSMSKMLYWNLIVPASVSGNCSGSIVVTAIADT